jgi:hypothetical protein
MGPTLSSFRENDREAIMYSELRKKLTQIQGGQLIPDLKPTTALSENL